MFGRRNLELAMIDQSTNKGRAVAAAMRLAERKAWRGISLLDIADEAGIPLADLSKDFSSRGAILCAFARMTDEAVMRKVERFEAGEAARERVFDVIMTRFEVLAPYRTALKRIVSEFEVLPGLLPSFLNSQHWMLAAAGIPSDGPSGLVRQAGLAGLYARTFRTWLDDDDPGSAKTMAALDRRLRRAERMLASIDETCKSGSRFFDRLRGARRRTATDESTAEPPAANI
jgi:AcrR family transcriptional regulator